MKLSQKLFTLIHKKEFRIGQISIQTIQSNDRFILSHEADHPLVHLPSFGGLTLYEEPDAARDLSVYADDGTYRFAKAETNLSRGWVMVLKSPEALLQALDHFYPAAIGLHFARLEGRLEIENLRDKLERQTGMYQNARFISDAGAQRLVREVCGPAHRCARRILWQIDADTPLEDSEANRYNGIPGDTPEAAAIPLLCREACNHFVAECRKASSAEKKARQAQS